MISFAGRPPLRRLALSGSGGGGAIPGTASAADIAAALALLSGDAGLRWVGTPEGDVQRAGTGRAVALPAESLTCAQILALLASLPDGSSVKAGSWGMFNKLNGEDTWLLDLESLGGLASAATILPTTAIEDATISWSAAGLRVFGGGAHLTGLGGTGPFRARLSSRWAAFPTGDAENLDYYGVGLGTTTAGQLGGIAYVSANSQYRLSTRHGTFGAQTQTTTANNGAVVDDEPLDAVIHHTTRGPSPSSLTTNYGTEYGVSPGPLTLGASTAYGPNLRGASGVAPVCFATKQRDFSGLSLSRRAAI